MLISLKRFTYELKILLTACQRASFPVNAVLTINKFFTKHYSAPSHFGGIIIWCQLVKSIFNFFFFEMDLLYSIPCHDIAYYIV